MSLVFRPVRLPKRTLTTEQAAKFAALRQEVETELAARCASAPSPPNRHGGGRTSGRGTSSHAGLLAQADGSTCAS